MTCFDPNCLFKPLKTPTIGKRKKQLYKTKMIGKNKWIYNRKVYELGLCEEDRNIDSMIESLDK